MDVRKRHRRPSGFSLLEMMIVLFIVGLAAAAVVLSLPGENSALRREAESFAAKVATARDESILTGSAVAVVVNEKGYYFERRSNGRWVTFDHGPMALTYWKPETILTRRYGASAQPPAGKESPAIKRERLVFDPVGLGSNTLDLNLQSGAAALTVTVSRTGEVTLNEG